MKNQTKKVKNNKLHKQIEILTCTLLSGEILSVCVGIN